MKYPALVILLSLPPLASAATPSRQQASAERGPTFGLLASLNVTDLDSELGTSFDVKSRKRARIEGFVRFPLSERLDLETRFGYSQTGASFGPSPEDGFSSGRFDLDYLSFPVLLRYPFGEWRLRPYIAGGVEIDVKTSARARFIVDGSILEPEDFDADVNAANVSLQLAGGLEIPAERVVWIVEVSMSHGVVDINTAQDDPDSVKSRAFRLSFGVRF